MEKSLAEHYKDINLLDITPISEFDYLLKFQGKNEYENECYLFNDGSVLKIGGDYSESCSVISPNFTFNITIEENEIDNNKVIKLISDNETLNISILENKIVINDTSNEESFSHVYENDDMTNKMNEIGLDQDAFISLYKDLNNIKEKNVIDFLSDKIEQTKRLFTRHSENIPEYKLDPSRIKNTNRP